MRQANFGAVRPFATAAVLALLAAPSFGQVVEKGRTFADLTASHPCDTGLTNRIARVTDCDAADDVGDGEGAFQCWVSCDGSAPWVTQAIGGGGGEVDLSGYVKLAGDEDGQTIQGVTGVTDEVSRVVLDYSEAKLGGPLVGTAYGHVTASGDGVVVSFTNGDTISGQIYSTTDGTGISTWNGFTIAAGDAISIATIKDEVVAEFMAKNAATTKSGLRVVASATNGTNGRSSLYVDGNEAFYVTALRTVVQGCADYGPLVSYATIGNPIECDKFFDTTLHIPCFYNGTDWKSVIDGTTTCTATTP